MEDFDQLHARLAQKLEMHSYSQKVPGLEREDVLAEMQAVLWKAWLTYDPERSEGIERRWWVMWVCHKARLAEYFFAKKRPMTNPFSVDYIEFMQWVAPFVDGTFPKCPDLDPIAKRIWHMLGSGYERREILSLLGISKRQYEFWRNHWRTPEVRLALA